MLPAVIGNQILSRFLNAGQFLGGQAGQPFAVAQDRQAAVAQHGIDPAARRSGPVTRLLMRLASDLDQRVLQRLFGQILSPQHPLRDAEKLRPLQFNDPVDPVGPALRAVANGLIQGLAAVIAAVVQCRGPLRFACQSGPAPRRDAIGNARQ